MTGERSHVRCPVNGLFSEKQGANVIFKQMDAMFIFHFLLKTTIVLLVKQAMLHVYYMLENPRV